MTATAGLRAPEVEEHDAGHDRGVVSRRDAFRGLSAFPVTPQDEGGRVDTEALGRILRRLAEAGVSSVGLLGSTGSAAYLERAERRRAIETAVDVLGGAVPLLVGIGALRTADAIGHGEDARAIGADAVLLAPVSYVPLTEDEVFTLSADVAREVGLPLCLYNNPTNTRFSFTWPLVARLSRIAPIAAVKNPAGADATADAIRSAREAVAPGFSLGWSVDAAATEAMLAGGDCWYSVLAGVLPAPCVAIVRAVADGDAEEARRIASRLAPLLALFRTWSGYRVAHALAECLGLSPHRPPRPLLPLPPEARAEVRAALASLGDEAA